MRPYDRALNRAFRAAYYGAELGLIVPENRIDWIITHLEDLGMKSSSSNPRRLEFPHGWRGVLTLYSVKEVRNE